MPQKYQIETVRPSGYYNNTEYSYENYLEKSDYIWYVYSYNKFDRITNTNKTISYTNKIIDFKLKKKLGEKKWYNDLNGFKEESFIDYEHISISLKISYFFKEFKPYELFEILAILNNELPHIDFKYFTAGEKYGYEDNTIVKYDNKIIKYFYIVLNNKQYKIYDYYLKYKSDKSESKIASIVEEYLFILEHETEIINKEEDRKLNYINNHHHKETYSIEDSYFDGGGGDEWSDPSEFW